MGVLGAIVIGGGATLGMNMTTDIPETSTERPTRSSAISTTKATTTTSQEKSKTKEPVVTHTEVETEINDYWFTETVAVEVPMQPIPATETVTVTVTPAVPSTTITSIVTETVEETTYVVMPIDENAAPLGAGESPESTESGELDPGEGTGTPGE